MLVRWLLLEELDLTGVSSWSDALGGWISDAAERELSVVILGPLVVEGVRLDPFAALGALNVENPVALGALGDLGTGRLASMMAREATTFDHLNAGGAALLLRSADAQRLEDGVAVASSLFTREFSTAGGDVEKVENAPNRPRPLSVNGPQLMSWDTADGLCLLRNPDEAPLEIAVENLARSNLEEIEGQEGGGNTLFVMPRQTSLRELLE